MRVPNNSHRGEVSFNMTPMIDVVFLLIIFFLVSSHLVKQETQMKLTLPEVAKADPAIENETPRVTINVTEKGELIFSGHLLAPSDLRKRLEEKVRQEGKDLEVRIRSDRSVPYATISPIMIDCTKVGLWNITFAVYRKGDTP